DRRTQLVVGASAVAIPVLVWAAVRMAEPSPPPGERPHAPAGAATALAEGPELPSDVAQLLEQERYWRAARRLRDLTGPATDPALLLVAAKTEAGWGGWENVFDLLEGKNWLDRVGGGDGWYLLGRAWEQEGEWNRAAAAYGRYVALQADTGNALHRGERAVGELRHALALLRAGRVDAGVAALDHVRGDVPAVAGWAAILAAEALAERGDTARVRRFVGTEGADLPSPGRARSARLHAYLAAHDTAGARALAVAFRAEVTDPAERAALDVTAARAMLQLGDTASARASLRDALAQSSSVDAARLLSGLPGLTPNDRLAIAGVYDRAGNKPRAIDGYRAYLTANPASTEVRLKLVRALFAAGRYGEVGAAAEPLYAVGGEVGAEAMYTVGRAQYRRDERTQARATFLRVADRFPGTPSAAQALFLVADLAHDAGDLAGARAGYRRTAQRAPGTERAGLALMRLGGMAMLARDYPAAQAAFDEGRGVTAYWPQATYWAGRARAARGDSAGAATLYREVRARQPMSYYALRSAERLHEPYWPIPLRPDSVPVDGTATAEVASWLYAIDLLHAAGLSTEADAEVARRIKEAGDDRARLYPLAEAINERGYSSQGIRIALALQEKGEPVTGRFLRILYPLPYRGIIEGEARARGLDPAQVAAMIRQESSFNAEAVSGPGARGLMQVMPETGRGVAMGLGIRQWNADLLFNPEINVAMGTSFLAAQMRAYDGSLPSVYAAYNAGPGRIRTWSRFPEYRNEELFTERIPFTETRDYVKILTRNTAIYRGLYFGE
ncbi:MAG TPA: transglycosylase SLT domain-containing protein, partial [Longimicrobium sp.]|nr:transglycosylase SLT domain-containing protein [Longimicrobium sp.]